MTLAFIESVLKGGAKNARVIYLNNPNWKHSDRTYKDFVCVDGLQRYTAIKRFINNEIKVFGYYYNEYEDDLRMKYDMKINVNDLPTRKDVLQWYLQMNTGGTELLEKLPSCSLLMEKEDAEIFKKYCDILGYEYTYICVDGYLKTA